MIDNKDGLPHGGGLVQQDRRGAELLGIADTEIAVSGPANGFDRWLARQVLRIAGDPALSLRLWDGTEVGCNKPPIGRLEVGDRNALVSLAVKSELGFGDAYSAGRMRVDGDLIDILSAIYTAVRDVRLSSCLRRWVYEWRSRPRPNSRATAPDNIHHHYDLGNDFYRLWLDERMLYTCAYYAEEGMTLEAAQTAKMEHVCRKLQLEPGLKVVEAGCGWGALALYMAENFGVSVQAYNISRQQIAYAREQARVRGLEHRVEFIEDDYRSMGTGYDRFVSVGMLEHVGTHNYPELGLLISRCLNATGRGLLHFIGRNAPAPNNPWIEQRIFPGSRPPSLSEVAAILEPVDLSVLDIENLRLHYARTCGDWLARFDAASDTVAEMYDERFVRAWRLYLSGSVAAFLAGTLQLFQVVFAHGTDNSVPGTREHLYRR